MKKNMSSADRGIRLLAAAVMAALFFLNIVSGVWGIILITLSVVFVLTSIAGFCPLYVLFGINTCKKTS
jgi:hypothetical protein